MNVFKRKDLPVDDKPEPVEKPEFPEDRARGSGGSNGYSVEARLVFNGASEVVGGTVLGPNWKTLHFEKSPIGIPKGRVGWGHMPDTSLLPYESAQALRWWFLAVVADERPGGTLCVETRLIKHRCEYTFKEVAEKPVSHTDGREEANDASAERRS